MDKGLSEIFDNYQYLLETGWEDPDWLHPALKTEGTHIIPIVIRFAGNPETIVENGLKMTKISEVEYAYATVDLDKLASISLNF